MRLLEWLPTRWIINATKRCTSHTCLGRFETTCKGREPLESTEPLTEYVPASTYPPCLASVHVPHFLGDSFKQLTVHAHDTTRNYWTSFGGDTHIIPPASPRQVRICIRELPVPIQHYVYEYLWTAPTLSYIPQDNLQLTCTKARLSKVPFRLAVSPWATRLLSTQSPRNSVGAPSPRPGSCPPESAPP